MSKIIKQSIKVKATPAEVYETLMDSGKHSELTGDKAVMGKKEGDGFSAFGGYVTGRNIKLEPDKKIIQEWRGEEEHWPPKHFSLATFELTPVEGGTRLDFTHQDVPAEHVKDIEQGWIDNYWTPLEKMFGKLGD